MSDDVKPMTREELEAFELDYDVRRGAAVAEFYTWLPTQIEAIDRLLATALAGLADRDRLGKLLTEVAISGVEFDDERIGYVLIQIDRATWDAVQKASDARLLTKEDARGILRTILPESEASATLDDAGGEGARTVNRSAPRSGLPHDSTEK